MAVRYASQSDARTRTQTDSWAFFIRNGGNEGGCASAGLHMWPSPTGDYFVQVPWPTGSKGVVPGGFANFAAWNWDASNASTVGTETVNGWVVLRVHPHNPSAYFGVDGQFTVTYENAAPSSGPAPRREAPKSSITAARAADTLEHFFEKIADPAQRTQLVSTYRSGQAALATPLRQKSAVAAPTTTHLTPREHVPGLASKGIRTQSRLLAPDAPATKRQAASFHWLQTHQKELGFSVPANEPPSKVRRAP
jgi:hypothetical protein